MTLIPTNINIHCKKARDCTVIKTRFPAIYLQEKTQQQYIQSMIKFLWFNKQLLLLCLAGFSFCLVFLGQYIICHFLKKSSLTTSTRNFLFYYKESTSTKQQCRSIPAIVRSTSYAQKTFLESTNT